MQTWLMFYHYFWTGRLAELLSFSKLGTKPSIVHIMWLKVLGRYADELSAPILME